MNALTSTHTHTHTKERGRTVRIIMAALYVIMSFGNIFVKTLL